MNVKNLSKDGIGLFKKNYILIAPMLAISFVTLVFGLVFVGVLFFGGAFTSTPMIASSSIASMAGILFLFIISGTFLAFGATTSMAFEAVASGSTSLNTGVQTIKRRFFDLIIAPFFVGLLILVGAIFLILPGLIAMFLLILTIPALIVDNLSPGKALKQSYNVMKNNTFDGIKVIVLMCLIWIGITIISAIFGIIPLIGIIINYITFSTLYSYIVIIQVLFYLEATGRSSQTTTL